MNKNLKNTFVALLAILLVVLSVVGCKSVDEKSADNGKILLSVNPQIEIEYDKNGLVKSLRGVNDDGKKIVASYSGYVGKSAETVAEELVVLINEAGYFKDDFNGRDKNMVVKVNEGEKEVAKSVAKKIAEEVNKAMVENNINSSAVMIDFDDLDENGVINTAKAKSIALNQLGLTAAQFANTEYELDDGKYEFKFVSDGIEYEFEVDAITGKVLEADKEANDDWDDVEDDEIEDDLFEVDQDDDIDDDDLDDLDDEDDEDDEDDDNDTEEDDDEDDEEDALEEKLEALLGDDD